MVNPRHRQILEYLIRRQTASIQELADACDVSPVTIRRDLAALEAQDRLARTHGGATLVDSGVAEFAYGGAPVQHRAEKEAIGRAAAAHIQPGMAVSLDTGTTTLEVARAIRGMRDLRVLTTSLAIASCLCTQEGIEVVLLGGTVRRGSPDLTGPLTEENLAKFRVNLAILGADGVSPDGIFTTDGNIARVSLGLMGSAHLSILVIDSSKLEQPVFVRFAGWAEIDRVITDNGIPAGARDWLDEVGPRVEYVETKKRKQIGER
ncbi:DeoR/GlpR transcriptional regulator [bacterium]|nr:DeoR/GlpR transcriptional regulator [bacterium]